MVNKPLIRPYFWGGTSKRVENFVPNVEMSPSSQGPQTCKVIMIWPRFNREVSEGNCVFFSLWSCPSHPTKWTCHIPLKSIRFRDYVLTHEVRKQWKPTHETCLFRTCSVKCSEKKKKLSRCSRVWYVCSLILGLRVACFFKASLTVLFLY